MKHCAKCGIPLDDYIFICPKCGTRQDKASRPQNNRKRLSHNLFFIFLLWLFFWPIMIVIATAKSQKLPRLAKTIILFAYFSVLVLPSFILGLSAATEESTSSSISTSSSDAPDSTLFAEFFHDETLRVNFLNACQEIGIAPSEISQLNTIDDWAGGPRYSFTYKSLSCRVYCNTDSTVNCIKLGNNTDVYKQGFESYQIADYIVETDTAVELQVLSEEEVKSQLNFPATASFPWEGWTYGRERDLYSVSNTVLAKNALGIEEEAHFKLIYQVNNASFRLVYFELSGTCLVNDMDSVSIPERKSVAYTISDEPSSSNEIILIEGQTGNYGKNINIDGTNYINYYVPAGSYSVTSNVNWCKVYVADNDYFSNSEGYTENEIIETLEFSSSGETHSVTIEEGQHIELTLSAKVTLVPHS